jgi:tubulin polyglutamylase TTLL6/13
VQRYLHKPYLIDGLKFDMRIYVLVYGVDPLRIFVFREGLARFATEPYHAPYKGNMENMFMHLTNYAINKQNEMFEKNENEEDDDEGHKRSVSSILEYLEQQGCGQTAEDFWIQIEDICVKTIISAQAHLQHSFRSIHPEDNENSLCFEILGLDIFFDEKLKPWLFEVNSLASFATDSPLDKKIKTDLLQETVKMLNLS